MLEPTVLPLQKAPRNASLMRVAMAVFLLRVAPLLIFQLSLVAHLGVLPPPGQAIATAMVMAACAWLSVDVAFPSCRHSLPSPQKSVLRSALFAAVCGAAIAELTFVLQWLA